MQRQAGFQILGGYAQTPEDAVNYLAHQARQFKNRDYAKVWLAGMLDLNKLCPLVKKQYLAAKNRQRPAAPRVSSRRS